MSRILCTFPGKFGDLLWALPAIRSLSETYKEPIDLMISRDFGSIAPLLRTQPYLDHVHADLDWVGLETAPMSPARPPLLPVGHDRIFHLGLQAWPDFPLPMQIGHNAWRAYQESGDDRAFGHLVNVDLHRPWITPTLTLDIHHDVAVGFTDEYFELKYGLYWLLHLKQFQLVLCSHSARWEHEAHHSPMSWETAAGWLASSKLFVGCCSALHVLACAIGTPVIVIEPNPHRHADVFYPLGKFGPAVTLVMGHDGQPTFDARHLTDTITQKLLRLTHVATE